MLFLDDNNMACTAVLYERGIHGMEIKWNCLPDLQYCVVGFLICYTIGDSVAKCEEFVKRMDDGELLRKVKNSAWIYDNREEADYKIASVSMDNMAEGFFAQNQVFKAPCKIAIWTVSTLVQGDGQAVILKQEKNDTVCFRKLSLILNQKIEKKPAVMGGFFRKRVLEPEKTITRIKVSCSDPDACFWIGAVVYYVPGCKKPFPFAKETLGKELCFEGIEGIKVGISPEYRQLYQLIQ